MIHIQLTCGGHIDTGHDQGVGLLKVVDRLGNDPTRVALTATEVEELILDLQELRYKLVDHAIGVLNPLTATKN